MLTKQHHYASRLLDQHRRQAYRLHMCGLCHALGDGYGLMARWLTSHEMILLNLLTSAQMEAKPEVVMRRCPLNPLRQVRTNQDAASQLAAGAAVGLAKMSVADDVTDSGAWSAQALDWFLEKPYHRALESLAQLGFDTTALAHLSQDQHSAEHDPTSDPARPSALLSAKLFAMTAQLAQRPANAEALASIGAAYGAYLYLMDAYRDYPRDMVKGDYNPLRPYTVEQENGFSLALAGLRWLLGRFEAIQTELQTQLPQLQLVRYHDLIKTMLLEPLDNIIQTLRAQTRPLAFQRWRGRDALKAGLFMLPLTATIGTGGEPPLAPDELPMIEPTEEELRKPKGQMASYACLDTCCYNNSRDTYLCADCGCEGLECATDRCDGDGGLDCPIDGCDGLDCGGADCNCN